MNSKNRIVGGMLLLGGITFAAPAAMAATAACTKIDNRAFIDYKVGTVDQTQIGSKDGSGNNQTSFYVGAKVMFTVSTTDTANVEVFPGSTSSALAFKVSNLGNAAQTFALAVATPGGASPFSGTDDYNLTNVVVSLATVNVAAETDSAAISITGDTPSTATDGKVAVYALQATAKWLGSGAVVGATDGQVTGNTIGGATCTAAGPATTNVDFVVADGAGDGGDAARDGIYSAKSAYEVTAANLTITKTSAVVYDPINCSAYGATPTCTGTPRAIPGAVVEYTITIANSASGSATAVTVNDTVDSNLTFRADGYAALSGIQVTPPGGPAAVLTNATGDDAGSYAAGTKIVTVTGLTVANTQSALVKFRATVN